MNVPVETHLYIIFIHNELLRFFRNVKKR